MKTQEKTKVFQTNEFFPGGKIKSIFLCGIGYGDKNKLFPRSPRLDFDEACRII